MGFILVSLCKVSWNPECSWPHTWRVSLFHSDLFQRRAVGGGSTPGSGLRVVWRCRPKSRRQWPCSSKQREPVTRLLLLRGLQPATPEPVSWAAHTCCSLRQQSRPWYKPIATSSIRLSGCSEDLKVKLHPEQQPWICEFSNLILLLILRLAAQTDSNLLYQTIWFLPL